MEHISVITAKVMAEIAKKRLEAFEEKLAKKEEEAKYDIWLKAEEAKNEAGLE